MADQPEATESMPESVIVLLVREGWPKLEAFMARHAEYQDFCLERKLTAY